MALVLALLVATANCTGTSSPWPFTLVDITTTRHLAEVDLRQGESGTHGYLLANTARGYRCIGAIPGGVPDASVYTRLASSLQAIGVPANSTEVAALVTGKGAAGEAHLAFSFFFRRTAKGIEVAPITASQASLTRRTLESRALR